MNSRRIVTGTSKTGKSIVVSDGAAPRTVEFASVPGLSATLLWTTAANSQLDDEVVDPTPTAASWVPAPGGTNAMVIVFPPDATMGSPDFDPAAAGREYLQKLPGLAEQFEQDAPGMHRTDSIDYGVVLDGEICLELDDDKMVTLNKHDVVVQNGTRHAWRNRSEQPATVLFVLNGASRSS